jgi:hypothetical protein
MNKRNARFAGMAVAVATSAIGAGVLLSSSAMAATDDPAVDSASVSVVVAVDGGQPVSCSFSGVDLPALALPVPPEGSAGDGFGVRVSREADPASGPATVVASGGPEPTGSHSKAVRVDVERPAGSGDAGESGVLTGPGPAEGGVREGFVLSTDGPLPAGVTPADVITPRTGTAEECAAILADLPHP